MTLIIKLIREIINEIKIYLIDRKTCLFKIKKYQSLNTIKLNLGSGGRNKNGFINIDLNEKADIRLDLRKPLPFRESSVDYIYSEHFLEHLDYIDTTAIKCLSNYLNILKKGGKIKIVIPDCEKMFKAYVNKDLKFFDSINIEEKIPQSKKYSSIIDYVNYGIYQFGEHKYCYDFEKIHILLRSVGFNKIIRAEFDPTEDLKVRQKYSMYIIAEKVKSDLVRGKA